MRFAHILPTGGVSGGPDGTVGNQVEMRPGASTKAPCNPSRKLPGQDSSCRKSYPDNGDRTGFDPLAHALPTSRIEDPDLALIIGLWDRLTEECRRVLIETVRANRPTDSVD